MQFFSRENFSAMSLPISDSESSDVCGSPPHRSATPEASSSVRAATDEAYWSYFSESGDIDLPRPLWHPDDLAGQPSHNIPASSGLSASGIGGVDTPRASSGASFLSGSVSAGAIVSCAPQLLRTPISSGVRTCTGSALGLRPSTGVSSWPPATCFGDMAPHLLSCTSSTPRLRSLPSWSS